MLICANISKSLPWSGRPWETSLPWSGLLSQALPPSKLSRYRGSGELATSQALAGRGGSHCTLSVPRKVLAGTGYGHIVC